MNKIELMGRLVADVELKKATKKDGADYTKFTLAVPRKNVKDKPAYDYTGQWIDTDNDGLGDKEITAEDALN